MNYTDSPERYYEVYRRQLAREMDAMGYGQKETVAQKAGRRNRFDSPKSLLLIALGFVFLTLVGTQM